MPVDEPPTEEEWLAADLAVVLGGAIGVYDQVLYPFLKDEKDLIRKRLESQKPLLGICLGAQLIASVLKSRVYPGKGKEIGWGGVELTEAGRKSPLRFLDGYRPVLHWHGDTFDLPEGAELLASTPVSPHQAFRMAIMCWHCSFIQRSMRISWKDGSSDMPVSWPAPQSILAVCAMRPNVRVKAPKKPDRRFCASG